MLRGVRLQPCWEILLVKYIVSAPLPLKVAVLEGHPQLSTEFYLVALGPLLVSGVSGE